MARALIRPIKAPLLMLRKYAEVGRAFRLLLRASFLGTRRE